MRCIGKELDEIDKKIIDLMSQGKTYNHIAWATGINVFRIHYRVRVMKKWFKCDSIPALIAHLYDTGLI